MFRKTSATTAVVSLGVSVVVEFMTKLATVMLFKALSRNCDPDIVIRRRRATEEAMTFGFVGDKCVLLLAPFFAGLFLAPTKEEWILFAVIGVSFQGAEYAVDVMCGVALAHVDRHVLRVHPKVNKGLIVFVVCTSIVLAYCFSMLLLHFST